MTAHQQGQKPLVCLGVDLQRPADRTSPGKWPHIENVVAVFDGTAQPRPGLGTSALLLGVSNKTPWHSIRTLNDPTAGAGTWCRVHGIQDRLAVQLSSAPATTTDKLGGWSGNPLSFAVARPSESPQPFMYVADSALMRKVDVAGNLKQVGLPPPLTVPTAQIGTVSKKTIDLFEATTGWAAAGGMAAPTLLSAGPGRPVDTTVPASNGFVRDLWASSGFTCIAATSMINIIPGSVLSVAASLGTEAVHVIATHGGSAANAIVSILYDSGTTGLCTMVLTNASTQIEVNSLLLITGVATAGTEVVRVHDVIRGVDDTVAIRTSTASNRAATDTVAAQPSFDCVMLGTPTAGGAIQSDGMRSVVAAAIAGPTPGTLSKVISLDLSQIISSSQGSTLDDWMSMLIRISAGARITELRIMLDCASDSVSAGAFTGTEFTKNYFMMTITESDLQALISFSQTAIANRQGQVPVRIISEDPANDPRKAGVARMPWGRTRWGADLMDGSEPFNVPGPGDITSDPGSPIYPPRVQFAPGTNQFSRLSWRLSAMQRVGTDLSRGWKDIVGIRIAVLTTTAVDIDLDAWIIHGGSSAEVSDVDPGYQYRYFGYDSATGVRSNCSPASVGPVRVVREQVFVSLPQHPSSECDKLGIERYGGATNGWHWIGTVDNSATPTFIDTISNSAAEAVARSEDSGLNFCQLWPLPQKPLTGSGATVAGTLIRVASAVLSTSIMRGSPVIANGKQSLVRRVLSTTLMEAEDNMGYSASATWELPRRVLMGQPLPILFGEEWDAHRLIGLGDPADPSAFYVTRLRNYDSTHELLRYEVAGAILQNGAVYNGQPYIWSTEHLYRVEDRGVDQFGNPNYKAVIVPGARGLIARWACCKGDLLYWLDKEGICASNGGADTVITDEDLYPLFPHGGVAGQTVNGLNAPQITLANEPHTRLSYGGGRLRFIYVDPSGPRRELEYRIRPGDAPNGWYPHIYTPSVACAYYEEGPSGKHAWLMGGADAGTAKLYQLTDEQSDGGTAIAWTGTPQYENMGDPRSRKRFGDYSTEVDVDGATVNVTPKFDNGASSGSLVALAAGSGRMIRIGDLGSSPSGSGTLATNMSLLFAGSVTTERPILYTWEPSWLDRPLVTALRATDFEDPPPAGPKLVRGVWLIFDTLGSTRAASVYRDGNLTTAAATLTGITSASGPKRQYFAFATPFYASTLLVVPTDAASWMLFGVEFVADPAPESSDGPEAWSDLGYAGAKWIYSVIADADTEGATVSLVVEGDEGVTLATITNVLHNGRAQKCYAFNPPLLTHLVRLNPSAAIRLWPTPPTRWDFDPEPELATHYETQQTTHDIPEPFKILRDAQITLRSSSTVTFSIYDGSLGTGSTALYSGTISSTGGLRKSVYVPLTACKARSFIYVLDSSVGFAVYRRDSWVRVRGWGRTVAVLGGEQASNWQTALPFGTDHRLRGATT